jgi:hypothetical protein
MRPMAEPAFFAREGLLGDAREQDVLFDIDADFNYLATTDTTYELLRLY